MVSMNLRRALDGRSALVTLAHRGAWSIAGEVMGRGLFLLSMLALANILSSHAWGQFGLVRTTIMTFSAIGGLGLGLTANRYLARHRDNDPAFCGALIATTYALATAAGIVAGAALILFGAPWAEHQMGGAEIGWALRVSALLVLISAVNGAQVGVLQGLGSYALLMKIQAAQGLIGFIAFVSGAYYFALDGAMAGYLTYCLVGVILCSINIRRELKAANIRAQFRGASKLLPLLMKFSVPVALMGIAVAPFKWLAESMLARTAGFSALGSFYTAMLVGTAFVTLASTLHAPLVSHFANIQDDQELHARKVTLYSPWYMFVALAIPFILLSDFIAPIAFGDKYISKDFITTLILAILYSGMMIYYQGIMRLVMQQDSMWLTLWTNLGEGLAVLAGAYMLSGLGAAGLALAYVSSYVFRILISLPVLFSRGIVNRHLLFDKYFVTTAVVLASISSLKIFVMP